MDPETLLLLAEKNSADIEAIISEIGIAKLLKLVPNFAAILKTLQAPKVP